MRRGLWRVMAVVTSAVLSGSAIVACGGGDGGKEQPSCSQRVSDAHEYYQRSHNPAPYVDLSGCDLSGQDWADETLRDWNLSGARLVKADLSHANLEGADLSGADLTGAVLNAAKLEGATVQGATFTDATLREADLTGADFSTMTLKDVTFELAYLEGASFSGATLDGVDFTSALMRGADLTSARLREVDLTDVNGEDINFTGATLHDVTLQDADLQGAVGLTDAALADAFGVARSRLAQALASNSTWLQSDDDVGRAVRAACQGKRIRKAVAGVSSPPTIAFGRAGDIDWAVVDGRPVAAARFIDVVVCEAQRTSRTVMTCGPYVPGPRYFDLLAETVTLRIVDPWQQASQNVTLSSDPDECPYLSSDFESIDPLDMESDWVAQADRFARAHPG